MVHSALLSIKHGCQWENSERTNCYIYIDVQDSLVLFTELQDSLVLFIEIHETCSIHRCTG